MTLATFSEVAAVACTLAAGNVKVGLALNIAACERPDMKRLKDINWNQVYYFHEVARAGSMTLAAQALGVSPPTVSEQIKRLEELLEIELFKRSTRRIELTANGWEIFNCTREMFGIGVRLLDKVSLSPIGGYAARVGVQETISAAVALDLLYKYETLFTPFGTVNPRREACPETLMQRVLRGELDWGITVDQPRHSRLEWREIGSFEIVFCCSPIVLARYPKTEDILRALPLARSISDKAVNGIINTHLERLGLTPDEIIESDFREYCLGLAARGRCVVPIAAKAVATSPWRDRLQTFVVGAPLELKFYATWAKSNERMVAIRKLNLLLEEQADALLAAARTAVPAKATRDDINSAKGLS